MVAQFTEITGSTPELATQYLQLADFNIEQAMQLYFENDGAPLTQEAPTSHSAPQPPSHSTGHQDESGVIHVDSDDDLAVDESRSTPRNRSTHASTFEDDAAMARRLQEEMYGGGGSGGGGEDDVRAPMARTTETLVGPEADFDDDMHASILGQLRARSQRGGKLPLLKFLMWR